MAARHDYPINPGGISAAQASAQIMRVGNPIQNQQQRIMVKSVEVRQ